VDRRRLLLGDWNRIVRDPVDVLRLAFVAGTVVYALMGRSTAIGLAFASLFLIVAHIVGLPRPFDLGLIVAFFLIAWGTALNLYGDWTYYDKLVHGASPIFWSPVLYIALARMHALPDIEDMERGHRQIGLFVVTLALGMAVGAGYEIVEYLSDTIAGTHFVKGETDTATDLIADTAGAALGALSIVLWSLAGWGTTRRLPGEAAQRR
jgi:hypothetical protein